MTGAEVGASRRRLQLASVTVLGAAFATAKVIAIVGGPSGVGYQAALLSGASLTALLATWAAANTVPSLAAGIADAGGCDFFLVIARASGVALIPALIATWGLVLPELLGTFGLVVAVVGLSLGTVAALTSAVQPTLLTVFSGPRQAANFQLLAAVVGAATTIALVLTLPAGLLPVSVGAGALAGQASGLGLSRTAIRHWSRQGHLAVRWFVGESTPVFVSAVLSAGALTAVPLIVLRVAGPESAGLLRAAASLGGFPSAVFVTSVSLHYYPRVARLAPSAAPTRNDTASSVAAVGRGAAWASFAVAAVAPIALWLAYTAEFMSASGALALVLAGGLLRLLSLHNAYLLLAHRRRQAYLGAEALSSAALIVSVSAAARSGAVTLMGTAVWAAYAIHFLTTSLLLRRSEDQGASMRVQPVVVRFALTLLPAMAAFWASLDLTA